MTISIGRKILGWALFMIGPFTMLAQTNYVIDSINTNTKALIIGLDVLDNQHIWASGTNATVLCSKDGGTSWSVYQHSEADTLQFRAIKAISKTEALVMSAGEGKASQIFKFTAPDKWETLFVMNEEKGFIDAIELLQNGTAIVYGDAIDDKAFILQSDTDFKNWHRVDSAPIAGEGEGGFASSGSNIAIGDQNKIWVATGAGGNANVLYSNDGAKSWNKYNTPMIKGEAAGITAIRYQDGLLFIVGGDLATTDSYTDNLFISTNNGQDWQSLPQPFTKGAFYGSAISKLGNKRVFLVCGPNGADILLGEGEWHKVSFKNLWTAEFINDHTALLAGRGGQMIKVTITD